MFIWRLKRPGLFVEAAVTHEALLAPLLRCFLLSTSELYFLPPSWQAHTRLCLRETPRKTSKFPDHVRAQACAAQTDLAPPCTCAWLQFPNKHPQPQQGHQVWIQNAAGCTGLLTSSPPFCSLSPVAHSQVDGTGTTSYYMITSWKTVVPHLIGQVLRCRVGVRRNVGRMATCIHVMPYTPVHFPQSWLLTHSSVPAGLGSQLQICDSTWAQVEALTWGTGSCHRFLLDVCVMLVCSALCCSPQVREILGRCSCPAQFPMIKVSEGKYKVGDSSALIFIRVSIVHLWIIVHKSLQNTENWHFQVVPNGHKTLASLQQSQRLNHCRCIKKRFSYGVKLHQPYLKRKLTTSGLYKDVCFKMIC